MSKAPAVLPKVTNYGGVDDGNATANNTANTANTNDANAPPTPEQIRSHTWSTLALCSSVFGQFYLVFNVFPYSGFMVMHLIPDLTEPKQVGTYAGILTGSMKIATVFTAYLWGVVSDTYGRKFVLLFSSASCAVLMVAFGLASNFALAVFVRILLGLSNGIMTAARVSAVSCVAVT